MDIDGWTGRWLPIPEQIHFSTPGHDSQFKETRIRADGLLLWMEQDLIMPDGTELTWRFDGAMDGKMRPLYFVQTGQVLTAIAVYLLDQNFGGDTNRRLDGSQIGCEYWRLEGDTFGAYGVHHMRDGSQYPYQEAWRRAPD
jgi:hypothetical protein